MELILEVFEAFCETRIFKINGIDATCRDFGERSDHDQENAEEYGCGDMRFDPIPATDEVLKKYGITENEYSQIAQKLESGLSFGPCGWCV